MDTKRLNDEGRELWNSKARFWDALQGDEGNSFHRRLVEPSVLQLLKLQPGERVLDAALEPAFSPDDSENSQRLSWFELWQIPPVLTGRLRLA